MREEGGYQAERSAPPVSKYSAVRGGLGGAHCRILKALFLQSDQSAVKVT